MAEQIAFKVMTRDACEAMQLSGVFRGSSADLADGFIHMSTRAQLAATIGKHFHGQTDLVIVAVDVQRLGDAVRWERSRGGDLFPHLYGALPIAAVTGFQVLDHERDLGELPGP